ncbi:alpha/beta hydrolase family protein [Tumebacillus amylolyticus]|nr:hypothetical protein [Tumebacillus amylolyticus]
MGRVVNVLSDEQRVEWLHRSKGATQGEHAEQREAIRRFPVSVYYPVGADVAPEQEVPYLNVFAPAVEQSLQTLLEMGAQEEHLRSLTCGIQDFAEMTRTNHPKPVVVYSPAMGVDRDLYQYNISQLVQAGYVVVTVGAAYETLFTVMPDGEFLRQGAALEGFDFGDFDALRKLVEVRRLDLLQVLDELAVWNEQDPLLKGQLDLNGIGLIGHSLGGAAVYALAEEDSRVKAVVLQDPSLHLPAYEREVQVPLLLQRQMNTSRDDLAKSGMQESVKEATLSGQRLLFDRAKGFRSLIKIKGANHMTFCDFPILFGNVEETAVLQEAISELTVAFLDEWLLGRNRAYQEFIAIDSRVAQIDADGNAV